ncbi:aminoglycoside phosphotransferase family protein [Phytoactinopolyspora mesophila]|uniref:Hydroxyurea phosphotransferase n=1 Tax=Phytoactinopolyspora mesophila TaxID=2650750 RepID=A0A7K3M411_9ACTN|nr:aminoglycoside phosphotransferase family protein [Phytoactinopolyspora mesophila]NDL58054.1 hydroxyurea phosphotransferase [Phytoactinopolyspora mesophila]
MQLFRSLPRTTTDQVLLCTDLHARNILAAEREPWLVIDPKPYLGDPAYDPLQHMLHQQRLRQDPHAYAQRMADLLGLQVERLTQWLFARCVKECIGLPQLRDVVVRLAPPD